MKALLLLAAVASTAYVGYSYSSTNGESCLVCPMTGEPVFSSAAPEAGPCCAGESDAMLTSLSGDGSSCCSAAKSSCCSESITDVTMTSIDETECEGSCEKNCCSDKENAVDVTESKEEIAVEGEGVVAELTDAE